MLANDELTNIQLSPTFTDDEQRRTRGRRFLCVVLAAMRAPRRRPLVVPVYGRQGSLCTATFFPMSLLVGASALAGVP